MCNKHTLAFIWINVFRRREDTLDDISGMSD